MAEKEYIEREAALKAANRHYPDPNAMCAALVTIPAADVREVVKAVWEEREVFPAKGNVDMLQSAFCPNCKRYHTTPYSYYFTQYNFCPNCGADMRGEAE